MKSDYRIRAQKFLKSIFNEIREHLDSPSDIDNIMWVYGYSHSRKISVKWGCARCAIITSDYVIKWDYDVDCAEEVGGIELERAIYEKAVAAGFGYLFAETTLIEMGGYKFSIMPRIGGIGRQAHKKGEIINYLDEEDFHFLHNTIIDMHSENWGLKNGYPVIIDYAYSVELTENW